MGLPSIEKALVSITSHVRSMFSQNGGYLESNIRSKYSTQSWLSHYSKRGLCGDKGERPLHSTGNCLRLETYSVSVMRYIDIYALYIASSIGPPSRPDHGRIIPTRWACVI